MPAKLGTMRKIQQNKKHKGRQSACTGTDTAACCTEGIGILRVRIQQVRRFSSVKEDVGCKHGNHRIQNLLQNLGNGRGHHVAGALEIAPENAQVSHDPHRRCQCLQRKSTVGLLQKIRNGISAEPECREHHKADARGIDKSRPQHPLRVPVSALCQVAGYDTGNGGGHGIARKDQQQRINAESTGIVAVALCTDDGRQGHPVDHADDPHQNTGNRQQRALDHKILSSI